MTHALVEQLRFARHERRARPAAETYGIGAPDRIRTCDLRLRRPTLYPLSYRREARSYRLVLRSTFGFEFDALRAVTATLVTVVTTLVERKTQCGLRRPRVLAGP